MEARREVSTDSPVPPMSRTRIRPHHPAAGGRSIGESVLSRRTVEVGKKANLVVLDANPVAHSSNTRHVAAVILAGWPIQGDLQRIR